jgi:hypothetical protein
MVSIYAEDNDHINVFGEWHKGKASIREDLVLLHSGYGRNSQRKQTIEKIDFCQAMFRSFTYLPCSCPP